MIDPTMVHDFHGALAAMFEKIRSKDGCLFYAVAIEDAARGRLVAVEHWRDMDALKAHLTDPELIACAGRYAPYFTLDVMVHEVSAEVPYPS